MLRKKIKKAFTLVELLVVIAILAILATVSVVGYTQFTKRAQQSNDMSLTTQINTVLQADEVTGKPKTMTEAINVMTEAGANIAELTPTTEGYSYVWNSATNRVILLDEAMKVVAPEDATIGNEADCYAIIKSEADLTKWAGYSLYFTDDYTGTSVTLEAGDALVGVDVGTSAIKTVNILSEETGTATLYTTEGSTVTVDAPNATINHYGAADAVNVTEVANNSYHLYATVLGNITIAKGRLVAEANSSAAAVIVTASEGAISIELKANSAIAAVAGTGTEGIGGMSNVTITGKENTTVVNEAVPAEDSGFAGGLGTEASPYLIDNAEQFLAIRDLLNVNGIYFSLLNNITLNTEGYVKAWYPGYENIYGYYTYIPEAISMTLNGNGNMITMGASPEGGDACLISWLEDCSLENLVVYMEGATSIAMDSIDSTFKNVITEGKLSVSNNSGAFTIYATANSSNTCRLEFIDCINRCVIISGGAATNYNAVFVGAAADSQTTLVFTRCINEGQLISGKTGMFLANAYGGYGVSIIIDSCKNEGIIQSTYTGSEYTNYNYYVGVPGTVEKVVCNGVTLDKSLSGGLSSNGFSHGPNDTMTIEKTSDNKFVFTQSNFSDVSYYVITISAYAVNPGNGTLVISVQEKINAVSGQASYSSTLKYLEFVGQKYAQDNNAVNKETLCGYQVVAIGAEDYYLIQQSNLTIGNGTGKPSSVTVSAYDVNGTLLSSASL